ncbi:MAG: hypothetical protein ACR2NU_12315 [Aeoliella sp.]
MNTNRYCYVVAIVAALSNPVCAQAESVPTINGTLLGLVCELTGSDYCLGSPQHDSRPYIEPSFELPTLYRASRHLIAGEVEEAARLAAQVDYEVIRFADTKTDRQYLVLREDIDSLSAPRGWGSYLLNPQSELPAIVEAPHPNDDVNTAKVAAMVFAEGAKGLLIAGAQRDKADVPDLVDSVFHQVHVAWSGTLGQMAVWQIHGFAIEKHPFPKGAKAILSTGGGEVNDEIVDLDDRLNERGIEGYAYNRLEANNKLNKWVNGGTPGMRFTSLAATKNEQGRHLRSLGGTFVHVELERAIRTSAKQRRSAAEAIAEAIEATATPKRRTKPKPHARSGRKKQSTRQA